MKKTIIFLSLIIISINVISQCNLPYKPLSAFDTDTIAFMTYNFKDRAECYIGKTLKEVSQDLQIPIRDFEIDFTKEQGRFPDKNNSDGIWIYIYPSNHIKRNLYIEGTLNYIYIKWESVIPQSSDTKKEKEGWTAEVYNYLKDVKIKSIHYTERIVLPKRPATKSTRERKRWKR